MEPLSLFHPQAPNGHSAVFSPCRTYRYALERRWGPGRFALFVGLNPSTADETEDDPTIRRCIGFAKSWGCGGLLMGNLFALRSTDPKGLRTVDDPVGPDNDVWLTTLSARAGIVVAAWGADPMATPRCDYALDALGDDVWCLGVTKAGAPKHPLYLAKATALVPFGGEAPPGGQG